MLENTDLYRTNWRKRYSDAFPYYHTRYTFIWMAGEQSYDKLQNFLAVQNYGKLSARFLVS